MSTPVASREDWVDAAKGIAICLVVLFHSSMFLELVELSGPWPQIVALLDTFRMPLFFFTAGLFARRAITLSLRELWSTRVANLLWLYGVWTLFWLLVFRPLLGEVASARVSALNPLIEWIISFILPNESTWFLWALAVYFLLAWAMRRLPALVQVSIAAVAAIVASVVTVPNPPLDKSLANFVFFLIALHLGPWVRRRVVDASWLSLVSISCIYIALLGVAAKTEFITFPGVKLALGALGVGFGISLAVGLVRIRLARGAVELGRRTLPIYLVHFYVAAGAAAFFSQFANLPAPFMILLVPTVTALSIAVSLSVHLLLRRVPGMWSLPRRRSSTSV